MSYTNRGSPSSRNPKNRLDPAVYENKGFSKSFMEGQPQRETITPQGNIVGLANGPLLRKRYINQNIERELFKFKNEIEEKFAKSPLATFSMPRPKL